MRGIPGPYWPLEKKAVVAAVAAVAVNLNKLEHTKEQ
jgi:hypothetical protein